MWRRKKGGLRGRTQAVLGPVLLDDRWKVRHRGVTLSTHVLKSDATDAGVKVAKANQPSELIICRMDGTIEDKRTYGDDPYPPIG